MIQVKIPNYLRKVQLSKARRATYFEGTDDLPEKYKSRRYTFKRNGSKLHLYDTETKEFVIKNSKSVGTPSYQSIAGNEIYARMHERKRMMIVDALKNQFKEHLAGVIIPEDMYPLSISMEIHSQYGYADWDLDNLWIYHKCFLDSLRDLEIIPDDNVLYIMQAGETTFSPIASGEPTMIFKIKQASVKIPSSDQLIRVTESSGGEPGKADFTDDEAIIYTGKKKVLFGAAKDAIRSVMLHALNNFKTVCVPRDIYNRYTAFFEDNRFAGRVRIIITSRQEKIITKVHAFPTPPWIGFCLRQGVPPRSLKSVTYFLWKKLTHLRCDWARWPTG